jgi:2,4-dienoyl-CoA reductase-like NADH-dependent reductase (Old Yellow Enzyme family)
MCQYSSTDGFTADWHYVHLGSFATGGPGLVIVEATGVVPEGRISIGCLGIWDDAHAESFKRIIDFSHSQSVPIGIQLAHAGRKGSTMRSWDDHTIATTDEGGWQTVSASEIAFHGMPAPRALTVEQISELSESFVTAAQRAVNVGFDVIELHAAHGYLFHQFLSPLSNQREDFYGGNFDGRTRFLRETAEKVRRAIPDGVPLFVRISATDWVEGGWNIDEAILLAQELTSLGVDLIDVSSGGLVHGAKVPAAPGYHAPFAQAIKSETGILTSCVGLITQAHQANDLIESGKADAIMMGREMLRNPRWALSAAEELGVIARWPLQYERARNLHKPK